MKIGHSGLWSRLAKEISAAETADAIEAILKSEPYFGKRIALGNAPSRIYQAVRDHDWPKSELAQVRFLADSLAAGGDITARRSRQLCRIERKKRGGDPWRS